MRAWCSVGHYLQGVDVIGRVGRYASMFGKNHLFLVDSFVCQMLGEGLYDAYPSLDGCTYRTLTFEGEISRKSISRLSNEAGGEFDVIVAVGGGKVIDVAKMVAAQSGAALVVCPTIAATDAPTSAMSILYSDEGEMNEIVLHVKNPDLVLVDSRVIANAPTRFLSAGIGDALSTYYEGESNWKTGHANYVWCQSEQAVGTAAGRAIARACMETLERDGRAAVKACEQSTVTPALENVIEANILMSGIGFENVGCSLAHGLGNAMTVLPDGEKSMHGERVGFSTLSLMIAEDYPSEEVERVARFCRDCGVPTTFSELSLAPSDDDLRKVAQAAMQAESWGASPVRLCDAEVVDILKATDALGRRVAQE